MSTSHPITQTTEQVSATGVSASLLTFFVSAVFAMFAGVIYAFAANGMPLLYFSVWTTILFGTVIGVIVAKAGQTFGLSDRVFLGLCAICAGMVGMYFAWAFDAIARMGPPAEPMLNPFKLFLYIWVFFFKGTYTLERLTAFKSDTVVSGFPLLLIWSGEFLIVLLTSWIPSQRPAERISFSQLPLLRRELTELANRRRTYVVRMVGAVVILFFLFLAYRAAVALRTQYNFGQVLGWQQFMGIGGDIFAGIAPTLFYTIQVLMPALCCASVTSEKENNTIGTLLLTKLSPTTIVLEKLGSRIIPMLTLILITFPVLAYVFTLGGVDTNMLIATLWLLLCECLLFASIAIMCSAWFPTTVSSFIWSYVIIAILAALTLSLGMQTFVPSAIWRSSFSMPQRMMATMGFGGGGTGGASTHWLIMVSRSVPSLYATFLFVFIARFVLVRRAFVSHSSVLLKVFRKVDGFFKELNERTTGGIELVADSNPLPGTDPVAWRERNKKSLGKARYLFRMLVALEIPTLFVCAATAIGSSQRLFYELYVLETLIWMLAVLVITVKGATLFSSERSKQTIEPLLASPMSAVEMVNQKIAGMRRLIIVMAVPILTVNLTHFLLNIGSSRFFSAGTARPAIYFAACVFSVFTLLYLIAWISTGIGLKVQAQTKAVLAAVSVISMWAILPMVFSTLFDRPGGLIYEFVFSFSPASLIVAVERFLVERYSDFSSYGPEADAAAIMFWVCARAVAYGFCLLCTVFVVQWLSPRLLNRRESPPSARSIPATMPTTAPALEGSRS